MKRNIKRYVIFKDSRGMWIARVPHGSYNSFLSHESAMRWIDYRIRLKAEGRD